MTGEWPPPLPKSPADFADPAEYLDYCYSAYYDEFYTSPPTWPGARFAVKRHPEQDGRCKTFWHIVSEGWDESSRTLNQARLERVCWARYLIDEYRLVAAGGTSTRVAWWKNVRGGETRVIIALADFSYIVVVAERAGYVLLWTAYPVERTHNQKKLRAEHDAYWK